MKKTILLAATLSTAMLATVLNAVEEHHPEQKGMSSGMQKGAMAGKGDMGMMKQNMHMMMKQMEDIHSTEDPEKRKQLMHEHMQGMQKNMQMMRNMGGGMMMGMMGDKKAGGEMKGKGMDKNMSGKDKGQRHEMMEQRMDMMQMMMEQMMGQMSARQDMMSCKKK